VGQLRSKVVISLSDQRHRARLQLRRQPSVAGSPTIAQSAPRA
jgi:hypothetical protein